MATFAVILPIVNPPVTVTGTDAVEFATSGIVANVKSVATKAGIEQSIIDVVKL